MGPAVAVAAEPVSRIVKLSRIATIIPTINGRNPTINGRNPSWNPCNESGASEAGVIRCETNGDMIPVVRNTRKFMTPAEVPFTCGGLASLIPGGRTSSAATSLSQPAPPLVLSRSCHRRT